MNERARIANSQASTRCAGDAGASVLEVTLAVPVLLVLVLSSVHIGLWFHAHNVVAAAAQEGARAARSLGGTDDDGRNRATQFLADVGGPSITSPQITVNRPDPETVVVTVTGQAPGVVAGLQTSVAATVTSPVEAFRP